MALFNKEKRISDRERLLGQELNKTRYENLSSALINEISLGSLDSKITRLRFPNEREIVILSSAGRIILARDSARPVNLSSFLYWTDLSSSEKKNLLRLANDAPLNENLFTAVLRESPDSLTVIRKAIQDSTVETLLYAHRHFSEYEDIDTDLYRNPDVTNELTSHGLDLVELEQTLESIDTREEELKRILGISGIAFEDLKLERGASAETEEGYVLEKRFVLAAAEAEANLADTYEISSGFRWVSVLNRLYELVEEKRIRINVISSLEALPSEIVIERPHEKIFHLTLDIDNSIQELTEKVFEFSGDLDLAKKLASDNGILEERIFEIEDWVIRELATEDYEDFEDLPEDFQISLRGLLLERREINTKRIEILERLSSLILEDSHTTEDDQLRELIGLKLKGIEAATDNLPASHEEVVDSGFHLAEEKPEFNFNDGRLVQNDEGAITVEYLPEDHEEELEEEAPVDLVEMIKIAVEENKEPTVQKLEPVDLSLLEDHISRLRSRRRKG